MDIVYKYQPISVVTRGAYAIYPTGLEVSRLDEWIFSSWRVSAIKYWDMARWSVTVCESSLLYYTDFLDDVGGSWTSWN